MENPHEQQHTALLNRIISNARSMNEKITELNTKLEDINTKNDQMKRVFQMWSSYNSSVQFHLQNTNGINTTRQTPQQPQPQPQALPQPQPQTQPRSTRPTNKTQMLRQTTARRRR